MQIYIYIYILKNIYVYIYIYIYISFWGVPEMGVPQNGWFLEKNQIKMDDFGVPYVRKLPYVDLDKTRQGKIDR